MKENEFMDLKLEKGGFVCDTVHREYVNVLYCIHRYTFEKVS